MQKRSPVQMLNLLNRSRKEVWLKALPGSNSSCYRNRRWPEIKRGNCVMSVEVICWLAFGVAAVAMLAAQLRTQRSTHVIYLLIEWWIMCRRGLHCVRTKTYSVDVMQRWSFCFSSCVELYSQVQRCDGRSRKLRLRELRRQFWFTRIIGSGMN